MLGAERLFARGVAPELATPVRVDEVDLSTPERMAANVLNMIPIFLVFAAFMGGMNVAIDAMAGERERGSLEPLLLNPVQRGARGARASGSPPWCSRAWPSACASRPSSWPSRHVPLQDLGVKARFDITAVLGMLATVVPLALFASAGQMLVSTYARSFKEAQTYIQLLLLLPMLPGMLLAVSPIQSQLWMYIVPVFGQQLLIGEVMRGQAVGPFPFLLGAAGLCRRGRPAASCSPRACWARSASSSAAHDAMRPVRLTSECGRGLPFRADGVTLQPQSGRVR